MFSISILRTVILTNLRTIFFTSHMHWIKMIPSRFCAAHRKSSKLTIHNILQQAVLILPVPSNALVTSHTDLFKTYWAECGQGHSEATFIFGRFSWYLYSHHSCRRLKWETRKVSLRHQVRYSIMPMGELTIEPLKNIHNYRSVSINMN